MYLRLVHLFSLSHQTVRFRREPTQPTQTHITMNTLKLYSSCAALFVILHYGETLAQPTLQADWWQGNEFVIGGVNASTIDSANSRLYVAGNFSLTAPTFFPPVDTRCGAVVDAQGEGWPGLMHDSPNNSVLTVIPDGGGGWFIGGSFTTVGGVARNGLARLNENGSLNLAWDPLGVQGGEVRTLLLHSGVLYVGGTFTSAGGSARSRLAAFDATTALLTNWSAGLGCNNSVNALVLGNGSVYIGGTFLTAGGEPRQRLAELDLSTGAALPWVASVSSGSSEVYALEYANSVLFVGGNFSTVNGSTRNNIAAVEANTGNLTAWNPSSGGDVHAIEISGDTAFVGGYFTTIGGANRNSFAALSLSLNTNNALPWNANLTVALSGRINAIVIGPDVVYIGGGISRAGANNQFRSGAACLDRVTAEALPWNPGVNGEVQTLAIEGATIYAGVAFSATASIGCRKRSHLASFDISTGKPTTWREEGYVITGSSSEVRAVVLKGDTLFIAGRFTAVDGIGRQNVAAIHKITGELLSWQVDTDAPVNTLELVGNILYMGGEFTTVNGVSRSRLAAVNVLSASVLLSWSADVAGSFGFHVKTLHAQDTRLYVGGEFSTVGAEPRNHLAAVSLASGQVLPFVVDIGGVAPYVTAIQTSISGDTLFVGGKFVSVAGLPRINLAAVDAVASTPLPTWLCNGYNGANYVVTTLLSHGPALYVGVPRVDGENFDNGLRMVRASTGLVAEWDPGIPDIPVQSLVRYGDNLFAMGRFQLVGGLTRRHISVWSGLSAFETSIITSVQEPPTESLSIHPNPATEQATLDLPEGRPIRTFALFDATGRTVLAQFLNISLGMVTLDLTGFGTGLYIVQVEYVDGTKAMVRLIKE